MTARPSISRSRTRGTFAGALLAALVTMCGLGARLTAGQMPNAAQMSGVPLPAADLPTGTVTVRVVRGDISSNVSGQTVELHGGPAVLTATTDQEGRAHFSGLAPGTRVHAVAVVDGTRLTSETFPVPAAGGVRVLLVAPAGGGGAPTGPDSSESAGPAASTSAGAGAAAPQAGAVRLGRDTQFIVEFNDDELAVFYLLHIVNPGAAPVAHDPLVFELPPEARGATLLEGSSPLATVRGGRLTVTGPFPAGTTVVQLAYQLPYRGSEVTVKQRLPAALDAVAIVAEKVGSMHLTSPQMSNHGDMPAEGTVYLVATGPALGAGETLSFTLTGLPTRARWPRTVALILAVAVLAAGAWAAVGAGDGAGRLEAERRALRERRDRLFQELVRLEEAHRAGAVEEGRYRARRQELVTALEQVYDALDEGLAA